MFELPRGYYAVDNSTETKNTFIYKGKEYSVTPGVNSFATLEEAMQNAKDIPAGVIYGLDYKEFNTPVVLFSAGSHNVNRFYFTCSVTLLGQNAGVNPNVPCDDVLEAPSLNPEREVNETLLKGSYWHGKAIIEQPDITDITLDGFSEEKLRFIDNRKEGADIRLTFRNIIHKSPCGNTLYTFGAAASFSRQILMQNMRVKDYDDLDYGALFTLMNAEKITFDRICYDSSCQFFGLTNMCRSHRNCANSADITEIDIINSYFGRMTGDRGISTSCPPRCDKGIKLRVSGCVFVDASPDNQPALNPQMTNDKCSTHISECTFIDTRNNTSTAVSIAGECDNLTMENCTVTGFAGNLSYLPPMQTNSPDYIERGDYLTDTEDPHRVISNRDYSDIENYYYGRKAYYGDLHVHTACGGTSDGKLPMKDWPAAMDKKGLDFAAVVDHKQMRGFFLPEWDDQRFIIGTEPDAKITDLSACRHGQNSVHYNMLFPHKYSLSMVLANFPEFEFCGDELGGSFKYPHFTKERLKELAEYVKSIGGMIVHAHPKTMLASDDPLDYYFCEHMYIETIYGSFASHASFKNYNLWVKLLNLGKHVYASCGSDTHGNVSNSVVSTFYTKEKNGKAFFDQMHTGDFTCGPVGMKMMIDKNPMGSEIAYHDRMELTLCIDDFFAPAFTENTAYELRIYTDKGLAYKSMFNGKYKQKLSLKVENRRYYRAEVFDITHDYRIAIGNPIWLDK